MIASMTAFGRTEESGNWGNAIWEIRTVNHRYLDVTVRLPDELRVLESAIRERVPTFIQRGKVDCTLRYEAGESTATDLPINTDLASRLINAAQSLNIPDNAEINPFDVLRWPGVINGNKPDIGTLGKSILTLLDQTLTSLVETRQREGEKISSLISDRCDAVTEQIQLARKRLPEIQSALRERYISRAKELQVELDSERLEQEILILTQKMDIMEEIDRLEAHITEVKRVLKQKQPVGRRLDFLMQEMNREANTLGSKSMNIDTTNVSVELKVLIEQMREQIQNIE